MKFRDYLTIQNKIYIFLFLFVPIGASIFSSFHMFQILSLGNPVIFAIGLSVIYEFGHIGSFMALFVKNLKKLPVIIIFIILFLMQIIGNIYFSYDYITASILLDSTYLNTFSQILNTSVEWMTTENYFEDFKQNMIRDKMLLSCILGIPVPLLSILFLKTLGDYITNLYISFDEELKKPPRPKTIPLAPIIPTISGVISNILLNKTIVLPSRKELSSKIQLNKTIVLPSR